MPTQPAKDYNLILTEEVLMPMLAVADFDERRTIFREQVHRAFEPAFLPTMLHVLGALREMLPQQDRDAAPQLLAAIMFELRDYLAPLPSAALGPEAVAIELLTAAIAADLGNLSHTSDEEPFVATLRIIVRRDAYLAVETRAVAEALARFAAAAEARADTDDPTVRQLGEQAAIWRELPDLIQAVRRVLRVSRTRDRNAMRQAITRNQLGDSGEALILSAALLEASEAERLPGVAEGVRQLMFELLAEGAKPKNPEGSSNALDAPCFDDQYRRAPALLTTSDLAQFAKDQRQHELIGGELFISPAIDQRTEEIINTLRRLLSRFVEEYHHGTVYAAPLTIQLSEHDVVKPALAFVGRQQQLKVSDGVIEGIPELIIEVKTDTTNEAALGAKTTLYGQVGVPECWLIVETQWHQALQAYGQEYGRWVLFGMNPVIRSRVLPDFALQLTDIFGPAASG